jgi:hypothetical protein
VALHDEEDRKQPVSPHKKNLAAKHDMRCQESARTLLA